MDITQKTFFWIYIDAFYDILVMELINSFHYANKNVLVPYNDLEILTKIHLIERWDNTSIIDLLEHCSKVLKPLAYKIITYPIIHYNLARRRSFQITRQGIPRWLNHR